MNPLHYIFSGISGILFLLSGTYILRSVYVTRRIDVNFYFSIINITSLLFIVSQGILTGNPSSQTILIIHRLKVVSSIFVGGISFLLASEITGKKSHIFKFYCLLILPSLLTSPFPIFTSPPFNSVTVSLLGHPVTYHFASTGIMYSYMSVIILLSFIGAAVDFLRHKDLTMERRIIVIFIFTPVIITAFNDYAVTHGLIDSIMLTEFSIFFIIGAVLFALLKEEQARFRMTMKHNLILEQEVTLRTQELEEKNTVIMDSIRYALTIQKSILPDERMLANVFNDYFVIWKERDIVGGDQYWAYQSDNYFYWAVADATGHGVSGALMTVMINSELNVIIDTLKIEDPGLVLTILNRELKVRLKQEGRERQIDSAGLDIAICGYRPDTEYVSIATAGQSIWMEGNAGVTQFTGDKQSIGYADSRDDYGYASTRISLSEYHRFYLLSDGYYSQLNENTGFQMGKKNITRLISENLHLSMKEQHDVFLDELVTFSNGAPQTDDVTVFAVDMKSFMKN